MTNRIYLLNIGTDYVGTANALNNCVHDANDWNDLFTPLVQSSGGSSSLLRNSQATRTNVISAVRNYLAMLTPLSTLIITRSGHGTQVPNKSGSDDESDNKDEAFVCDDLKLILDDEWDAITSNRDPASYVFIFDDCCHSGTGLRAFGIDPDPVIRGVRTRFLPFRLIPEAKLGNSVEESRNNAENLPRPAVANRLLISGCQDHQYSYDSDSLNNGAATYYAIKAYGELKQAGKPATYQDWYNRIRLYLPRANYKQDPNLYVDGNMASFLAPGLQGNTPPVTPPPQSTEWPPVHIELDGHGYTRNDRIQ